MNRITKSDALLSVRERLEFQKLKDPTIYIIEQTAKAIERNMNSATSRAPYIMSDAVKNILKSATEQ